MANKVIGDYSAAASIDGANHYLLIQPGNSSTAYNKINRNILLNLTSQPLGLTDVQSPTNKTFDNTSTVTLKDTLFTLQDDGDTTKQAKFQLSGITTGTTRTYTLPNASSTLADIATVQTFTNKTLTSPVITGGTIDNTTITVDSISGHTTSTVVTVGGVQMNNGVIGTSAAVTSNSIAAGAVTPNSLVASSGSGWTFQTFTPSFTNLTVGNGQLQGRYTQIGKMIWVIVTFNLGSTSAIGSSPTFTPPVAASSFYSSNAFITQVGFGDIFANTGSSPAAPFFNSSTNTAITIGYYNNGLITGVSSTAPGTWAANGQFTIQCFYEAA